MFFEILHETLIALIVSCVGLLSRRLIRAVLKDPNRHSKSPLNRRAVRKQFYGSLLVLIVSLSVICSVTWEFSFSWPVIVKGLAIIMFLLSLALLCGSFDALDVETTDDPFGEDKPDT